MNVFLAGIAAESCTRAQRPTTLRDFASFELFHGDASRHTERAVYGRVLRRWRDAAEAAGAEVFEGLCAAAEAGGPLTTDTWHALRDELLADLRRAPPPQLVLLNLHGAMLAEGCDDCEGELLGRVRAIVGPDCTIAALLDLHGHLSDAMQRQADLLLAYREYPHTDVLDRAEELWNLARRCVERSIRPVTASFDCRMVGAWPTTAEPLRGLVRTLRDWEQRPGLLSISLGHGFPWADVPGAGAKAWAIADADPQLAAEAARRAGLAFYRMRRAIEPEAVPVERIAELLGRPREGRLVLADLADNPGGGAPGDSTLVVGALLEAGVPGVVAGCLVDPEAVSRCRSAGPGATLRLSVGARSGYGAPLVLEATVRAFREHHVQTGLLGEPEALGASAWIQAHGCDIVLCSLRTQTYHPDAFTSLGLELPPHAVVLVKSAWHFQAAFAPLAARIAPVQSAGMLADPRSLAWKRRDTGQWPMVDDPLGDDR
jgi:microcystin degradation protein MlrC